MVLAAVTAVVLGAACGNAENQPEPDRMPLPTTPRAVANNPLTSDDAHLDSSPELPGQYLPPHPGVDGVVDSIDDADHVGPGIVVPICGTGQLAAGNFSDPLCYHSNPPTSGPHAPNPAPFQVLDSPAPKENLVHSMEHGGVVVWHNTSNQAAVTQLTQVVSDALVRGNLVVMSRYADMEADSIAITSWTRLDKFPVSEMSRQRIMDFIEAHQRRFNPEGF
jgi:hypothetical protein